MAAEKLEVLPLQVKKILQFYEATQQRMGVVIVGPSGCGKSTIWQMLKAALLKLGQKIPTYVMNPKSMPREQARDPAQLGPAALPTPHTPPHTPHPTLHLSPALGRRASSSSATWIWTHASGLMAC